MVNQISKLGGWLMGSALQRRANGPMAVAPDDALGRTALNCGSNCSSQVHSQRNGLPERLLTRNLPSGRLYRPVIGTNRRPTGWPAHDWPDPVHYIHVAWLVSGSPAPLGPTMKYRKPLCVRQASPNRPPGNTNEMSHLGRLAEKSIHRSIPSRRGVVRVAAIKNGVRSLPRPGSSVLLVRTRSFPSCPLSLPSAPSRVALRLVAHSFPLLVLYHPFLRSHWQAPRWTLAHYRTPTKLLALTYLGPCPAYR